MTKKRHVLLTKDFWLGLSKSKTVRANVLGIVGAVASEAVQAVIATHPALTLSAWGIANIILRAITKKPVEEIAKPKA